MSTRYSSLEWGNTTTYPEFGSAALHNGFNFETDWSNAFLVDNFGSLDSTTNPLGTEPGVFPFGSIPAQGVERDVQSSQLVDMPYYDVEGPGSTKYVDLHHSFSANNTINPGLELTQTSNIGYNSKLLDACTFAEPNCLPLQESFVNETAFRIDKTPYSTSTSACQSSGLNAPPGFETEEILTKDEAVVVASSGLAGLVGDENMSECSPTSSPALSESIPESFVIKSNQVDICFGVVSISRL
jgi:hypothetical protein